jgi:hypothetical protein
MLSRHSETLDGLVAGIQTPKEAPIRTDSECLPDCPSQDWPLMTLGSSSAEDMLPTKDRWLFFDPSADRTKDTRLVLLAPACRMCITERPVDTAVDIPVDNFVYKESVLLARGCTAGRHRLPQIVGPQT